MMCKPPWTWGVCVPEIILVSGPKEKFLIDSETCMWNKTGFGRAKSSSKEVTTLNNTLCGDIVGGSDMLLYGIFIVWDVKYGTKLLKIGMVSTGGSNIGTTDPKQIWLGDDDAGEKNLFPSSA
jgi:hypothetical protein